MSVCTTRHGAVLVVALHRPERRNAIDRATAAALDAAFSSFEEDPTLHVAVLWGDGGTFCAGADLQAIAAGDVNVVDDPASGPLGPTRRQLGKPVVAAIEGHAVAGGLELACWCDLRVAAEDATFGVLCHRFGVPLIDGGTVRLPRLIGLSRALDLVLTGRAFGAQEALEMGLVHRVTPKGEALTAALALAEGVASLPQVCLRNDRRALLDGQDLAVGAALRHEATIGLETLAAGEYLEGARRFHAGAGRHGGPA